MPKKFDFSYFERDRKQFFNLAYSIVHNVDDAEDVVQRAALRIYKNPPTGNFRSFILTAVKWEAYHTLRQKRKNATLPLEAADLHSTPNFPNLKAIHTWIDLEAYDVGLYLTMRERIDHQETVRDLFPKGEDRGRYSVAIASFKKKYVDE